MHAVPLRGLKFTSQVVIKHPEAANSEPPPSSSWIAPGQQRRPAVKFDLQARAAKFKVYVLLPTFRREEYAVGT